MAVDNLSVARTAKATLEYTADAVEDQVAVLYSRIVGDVITPESVAEFISSAMPLIRNGHRNGASLGASMYRQIRRLEDAPGRAPRIRTPEFNAEQAESSLRYLGLVAPARQAGVGFEVPFIPRDPDAVADQVGASAGRRVVTSHMDSIREATKADKRALGWARVTQGPGACYFCSMLESRGTQYSVDSFRDSDDRFRENLMPPQVLSGELAAKVHDSCRCIIVPVFSYNSTVQKNADELYQTWKTVQKDYMWLARRAGLDMIQIWRLYWEGRIEEYADDYR